MYGSATWATMKGQGRILEVNEMRMFGVTKKDEDAEVDVWSHEER